jgi:hypothetical protein
MSARDTEALIARFGSSLRVEPLEELLNFRALHAWCASPDLEHIDHSGEIFEGFAELTFGCPACGASMTRSVDRDVLDAWKAWRCTARPEDVEQAIMQRFKEAAEHRIPEKRRIRGRRVRCLTAPVSH